MTDRPTEFRPTPRRRWLRAFGVVGMALWIALPVLALVLLSARSTALEVARSEAVWVDVEQNSESINSPAGVQLFWTDSPSLVAPEWSGLVEQVLVGPGDTIGSGTPILVVDGIRRVAVATPVPFSGALSQGDQGGAVEMLVDMLRDLGYDAPDGDRYGWALSQTVKSFATDIGVPGADGLSFDSSWVVFLPAQELTVDEVDLTVAAPAPSAGAPFVIARPRLERALLVQADLVEELINEDAPEEVAEELRIAAADGQALVVSRVEFELAPGVSEVQAEALPLIEGEVQTEAKAVRANVRTDSDPEALVVPSSAVFAAPNGRICVIAKRSDNPAVEVEVVSQGGGRSVITGNLSTADQVQVLPDAEDRACG